MQSLSLSRDKSLLLVGFLRNAYWEGDWQMCSLFGKDSESTCMQQKGWGRRNVLSIDVIPRSTSKERTGKVALNLGWRADDMASFW